MRSGHTGSVTDRLVAAASATFCSVVPRDHHEAQRAFRRRQAVTAVTVVVGAVVLGLTLDIEPGRSRFYFATMALPCVWLVGGFAAGPLHLGWRARGDRDVRPVAAPTTVGLALAAVFVAGGLVTRQVPIFESAVHDLLAYAREGDLAILLVITAINGVAEEVFFRGALYASVPGRHQVLVTTVVYSLTVVSTGNLPLAFAAAVLGVVVGLQRRASGGILAPIITHVIWSTSMLLVLPLIFR